MTKLVMLRYHKLMRTAKISELKAKLSAHIAYVKRGEEVLILDRNTPVAKLVSVGLAADHDERLQRLVAKGIVSPSIRLRKEGKEWPDPPGPTRITRKMMEQVWREERDGR
ncbi:MAG: type II toxin-antitoxin system prevent-host-death family antitoxin [Acidobacteriota bacterium]|nr:type II toxin-antitoxin system prevent-host-death family antitoxin [Acidobacteriota bacterium]